MAEAFDYRDEAVTNERGETVDMARMRRNRGASWDTAVFRGTRGTGRGSVNQAIRSAAMRGANRNPAMRRR